MGAEAGKRMSYDIRLLGDEMYTNIRLDICWIFGLDPLCWTWTGDIQNRGYGYLRCRCDTAHRIAYQVLAGSIPKGLTLDHLCRNKLCCNPAHLEPVTVQENIRRAVAARSESRDPELLRIEFEQEHSRRMADAMEKILLGEVGKTA